MVEAKPRVRIEEGVVFGTGGGRELRCDLYHPPARLPTGGAYACHAPIGPESGAKVTAASAAHLWRFLRGEGSATTARSPQTGQLGTAGTQATLSFAVGTVVTDRPPHRTARAAFPHAAPTLGV